MALTKLGTHRSFVLSTADSHDLWNWLLRRQGLSEDSRLGSVEKIADAALGLHSARLPSPYSTVAARSSGSHVALSLFNAETRSGVMTVRCMRKTLHTLPLALAAAAHVATMHFRERDALRAIVNAHEQPTNISRVLDVLCDLLEVAGPLFHRDIESILARRSIAPTTTRLVLKLAWERGRIAYLNETNGWNREVRTFALTSRAYPDLNLNVERRTATTVLMDAYFDRYGPTSLGDAAWWSGLSRSAILQALLDSGREVVALTTPWGNGVHYMYLERFEQFLDSDPEERDTGINFLAHEDVALKAYFDSRDRYLGNLPTRRAFNQIGEVLPTVLHRGQVVGTWSWNERARRAECQMVAGYATAEVRKAIRARLAKLSETLQLGWSPARVMPSLRTSHEQLMIS
jgi:Winged helix DNA-binding domain